MIYSSMNPIVHFVRDCQKGNTLVMVLALILTFSTISIALSELITVQSTQVDYLVNQSKARYITGSGLIHMEQELKEDVSQNLTSNIRFKFVDSYCVAWIMKGGVAVCDTEAAPTAPCCRFKGSACIEPNIKGVCQTPSFWTAEYSARYDSISKSIEATGCIGFLDVLDSTKKECNQPTTNCFDIAKKARLQCPSFLNSQRLNLVWE